MHRSGDAVFWRCLLILCYEGAEKPDGVAIAALVTFMRRQIDQPPPPFAVSFLESVDAETGNSPGKGRRQQLSD